MNVFRAYADEWRHKLHFYVQVRVFDSRRQMHKDMREMGRSVHSSVLGQCSGGAWYSKSGRLTGQFAVIWLNVNDVQGNPAEIISHECIHAAMRHAVNRRVDLSRMPGEEVLCHTAGCLSRQINDRLHKLGIFE